MTDTEVDEKYALEPGTSKKLRAAMSKTWDAIGADCGDCYEYLNDYRVKGERPRASERVLEMRMITELTIDADRILMYGFERGFVEPEHDAWYKSLLNRSMKGELDLMKLGYDAYSATRGQTR